MREEHHIDNFDPSSFFSLHDFDNTGIWTPATIRRFYGLDDESASTISESRKAEVPTKVLEIFDLERTGVITRDQFVRLYAAGRKLPDFGLGPGHHGDDEYEYEIHHFEKFHSGDDVTEEDLIHPEDIEHFRKHDMLEDEQDRVEEMEKMMIVEANIPRKFRKQGV
ncbi:putative secretory pathway protein [Phaeomoniella chlamydospora]|uniref:Putative secretory pathway protein n=1 Tax=Phaeomoniella chlamydospora TaxID=158046 RepID=A0A0G2EQE1_PHACM|nr:putative secretory pathway protein [Phaeomoniella chlamydospora]